MRDHKTKILLTKIPRPFVYNSIEGTERSATTWYLNNMIPVSIAVPEFSSISSENPGSFCSLKPKQSLYTYLVLVKSSIFYKQPTQ